MTQTDYPTLNWTTDSFALASTKEKVDASQLDSLLRGRKFGKKEDKDIDMCPPTQSYDPEELKELEDYCKKRGIIGINFPGMSPKAILNMLQHKCEGKDFIKKEILHG